MEITEEKLSKLKKSFIKYKKELCYSNLHFLKVFFTALCIISATAEILTNKNYEIFAILSTIASLVLCVGFWVKVWWLPRFLLFSCILHLPKEISSFSFFIIVWCAFLIFSIFKTIQSFELEKNMKLHFFIIEKKLSFLEEELKSQILHTTIQDLQEKIFTDTEVKEKLILSAKNPQSN